MGWRNRRRLFARLIAREVARGVAAERIFLAGFSQGGAVVLYAGLRFDSRLAGIIALSTYLPLADSLHAEKSDANQSIFYAHGRDDPLIPISLARQSQRQLARAGYAVTTREYGIAHGVSAEEIDDVAEFLRCADDGIANFITETYSCSTNPRMTILSQTYNRTANFITVTVIITVTETETFAVILPLAVILERYISSTRKRG